ncbi:MAG: BrnT family toxin [Acidobacteriaceae bacterium]|jgi:uncharacterized DUF497 family protein|nr:BrnT family toxin [Acidobacteriaceae bacterium]
MAVTYGLDKDAKNRAKHDWSLADFSAITAAIVYPAKKVKDEVRYKIVGRIGAVMVSAIITRRGDDVRVISLRNASRKERRDYAS